MTTFPSASPAWAGSQVPLALTLSLLACILCPRPGFAADQTQSSGLVYRFFVGGYTGAESSGIHSGLFDSATGTLRDLVVAAPARHPSFLALHPRGRVLYAVNETTDTEGKPGGGVSAFAMEAHSSRLALLQTESTLGAGPCHVATDLAGRVLLVANYGGGSVVSFPLREDGRIGSTVSFHQHTGSSAHPSRQQGPHAHGIYADPASRFVLVPDLGLDQVVIYRLDVAAGALLSHTPSAVRLSPGAGPRHLEFDPAARRVYTINELSSTITVMEWEATLGQLRPLQEISTLPEGFTGANTTAEIAVHPSGRFVYASNRGHDSIAVFRVDPASGRLEGIGHHSTGGRTPRHFALAPGGSWLVAANQDSDNLVVLRISKTTGLLSDPRPAVRVPRPTCVVFAAPVPD